MNKEQFIKTHCHKCGSQRCEGIGTAWFEGCQHKDEFELKVTTEMVEKGYIDEVGGFHECGTSTNPMGHFCGECTNFTCKGCSHIFKEN